MLKINNFTRIREEAVRTYKLSKFYEKFVSELDDEMFNVCVYSNWISLTVYSKEGLAAVRKRFHDFDLTMSDAANLCFHGSHSKFPEAMDVIGINYISYFNIPKSKLKGNIDISYLLRESDLPAKFIKDGCGFKDVEIVNERKEAVERSVEIKRSFVCEKV